PVTAALTVNQMDQPTGNPTVINSLSITGPDTTIDPLTVESFTQTTPATSVALYNDTTTSTEWAYVCGPNGIDAVNVSTSPPTDEGTFGASVIHQGGLTVGRVAQIGGQPYLLVGTTVVGIVSGGAPPFTLLIYSLANPMSPSLVSETPFQSNGFLSDMAVAGNTLLVSVYSYFLFGGIVFEGQNGNVLSINLSNPSAPTLNSVLFGTSDPNANTTQYGVTLANSQYAYVASSTNTGGDTQVGVGRVLIVNYSNPADITYTAVDIPGTYQILTVAVEGNQVLAVGRTGGDDNDDTNGTMTLTVLTINNNDPSNLTVGPTYDTLGQLVTSNFVNKISALPLGNGLLAVSEATVHGNPNLVLVDPADPNNILASYTPVPALVNEMAVASNLLYASSQQGLTIYNIGNFNPIPLTISVEVPAGVSIVASSYSTPPTQVIAGTTYNTLVWDETYVYGDPMFPITWQSTVNNLTEGEVAPVTLGATGTFTYLGEPGTFTIPGTSVTGVSIISLLPAAQTVQPGGTATYDVQLTNPTSSQVTYYLSTNILDSVSTNYSETLAPDSTVDDPLQITVYPTQAAGSTPFTVTATAYTSAGTGAVGTTAGTLIVAGSPLPTATPNAYGVVAALTPLSATVGQEGSTQYVVQITNTGSTEEEFESQISGLPPGTYGTFGQYSVLGVAPGASNFRDIPLTVGVGIATPGVYPFTVTISAEDGSSSTTVNGTLVVVSSGVYLFLTPSSGVAPGGTIDAYIFNYGSTTDTFDLTLSGPGAAVATLGQTAVTNLQAGYDQVVQITTGPVTFAASGDLPLIVTATSQNNSAAVGSASTTINVAPSRGLAVNASPASVTLPQPGPTSFVLQPQNTGTQDDSYQATIVGTTGPVAASLIGLDGQPTQSIPIFYLPGLSSGAIDVNANLLSAGAGTVTVQVTSTDGEIVAPPVTFDVQTQSTTIGTNTTLVSDHPNGSTYGNAVTFTATVGAVSGTTTPTGSVQFLVDNSDLGNPIPLTGGTASITDSALAAGSYDITAVYTSNSSGFSGSSTVQALTQVVNLAPLTITANNQM
ncbi:MAG: Ig-like domain repeat protein, partial [Thermoguttaceae bacterium]